MNQKKKGIRLTKRRLFCLVGVAVLLLIFVFPLPKPLFRHYYSPVLYDRNGELLGALVAKDGQWRFPPGETVNEKFATALIEFEDRRFRIHPGVDPIAIVRAFIQNLRSGGVVSGGSTLTMQTVRMMRGQRRTLIEKVIEAALSLRLEIGHSKDDILALYAANAPFGGNVVGIEAASWRWFGRPAGELSWAEAATLAVLPNRPALVHPGRNRDTLKARRDTLLERLFLKHAFDEDTLRLAKIEPLPNEPLPLPRLAPHLLDRVVGERGGVASFMADFPQAAGNDAAPAHIVTTLDRTTQERTAIIMNRWAERFAGNGVMNGACLVMDTRAGEVLAYIGNVNPSGETRNSVVIGYDSTANNYANGADVDIIRSPRSSGSLLKPFLYAAMLDSGDILPTSLVSDIPTRVGSYSPENSTLNYLGVVSTSDALARSLNIPAVRSLRVYGVDRFARLLRSLGSTTLFRHGNDYGLPLILGGAEVTLWDMAALYAGLARTALSPQTTTSQFFPPTIFPHNPPNASSSLYSPAAAWLTLDALTFVARPGEEAAWQDYAGARRISWKTGTSFGNRDAWAIGTTPDLTIAVWIGNASGEGNAILRSAVTAAPVLFELFSALNSTRQSDTWFPQPTAHLRTVEVCAFSGYPAGPDCASCATTQAPRDAPGGASCPYCRVIVLNEAEDHQVVLEKNTSQKVIVKKWFVLPPAEEWYYRKWNLDYQAPPPFEGVDGRAATMALFNPDAGSQIYVPVELDGREGRIVFSAAHRESGAIIHWHLDDTYLGITEAFHEMEARPGSGFHTLTLIDNAGNSLSRRFEVLARVE